MLFRSASREQQEAQSIQRALLPAEMPEVHNCEIAASWKPAMTFGGDLYDVTMLDDGRVAISIGDVCGKGLPAALLMANVQASVRAFAALEQSPRSIVARLNRDLARNAALRRFVSLFFAVYDPAARRMTYCNAGHNPPAVMRADGSIARLDTSGTVVGAFEDSTFEEGMIDLTSGAHLVLFTDGIVEAGVTEDRQFGDDGLLDALRRHGGRLSARSLVDAIFAAAATSAAGVFHDDATVVVMAVH